MNGPRFSISFLLLMVVVIGIGLAAMTHPSDLWSSVLFSVMMLALHTAIVGILVVRGRLRAFWIAFAVFGWGYWVMSSAPWIAREFRPNLVSDHILISMYPLVIDLPAGVVMTDGGLRTDPTKLSSNTVFYFSQLSLRHFKDIGHYLTNLILALLAGYVAWLAVRKEGRPGLELPCPPESPTHS